MKRLFKRLSWLTMVIVVGSIAIAQAQRSTTVSPSLSESEGVPVDSDHAADVRHAEGEDSIPAEFGPFTEHRALPRETDSLAGSLTPESRFDSEDALSPSIASGTSGDVSTPGYSASDVPDVESEPEPRFMRARRNAAAAKDAATPAAQGAMESGNNTSFSPLAAAPQEPRRISESAGAVEPSPLPNSETDPFANDHDSAHADPQGTRRTTTREGNGFNPGGARIGLARREIPPTEEMQREPRTLSPEATNETFGDSYPPTENGLPGRESPLPVRSEEGTGLPGPVDYEGLQTPTLAVEKFAPAEIQMGQSALFEIRVRNASSTTVHNVRVLDEIPQGTRLMGTTPESTRGPRGELVWEFAEIRGGEEKSIQIELMPMSEGEIGSVARVEFAAMASVRSLVTRPELSLEIASPREVLRGEEIVLSIRLANVGTGVATGVLLEEIIPTQMRHPAGSELEMNVGTLKPGEERQFNLRLQAIEAGRVVNTLTAHSDGNLLAEDQIEFDVVAPGLAVEIQGPSQRYLDTRAQYRVAISNPGTAAARDIELVAQLPSGMQFVETNHAGQYDPATHSVYWSLVELPAQEVGVAKLILTPHEAGGQVLRATAKAQQSLSAEAERSVQVEGLAAISFTVADVEDPIEVGGDTLYEIRVVNQGSKASNNIRVEAVLPREMTPVFADGPVRHAIDGQRVIFAPLKSLAPKADTTFYVRAQAEAAGDLRVRVEVLTDEITTPVVQEQSTRAYSLE